MKKAFTVSLARPCCSHTKGRRLTDKQAISFRQSYDAIRLARSLRGSNRVVGMIESAP